MGKYISVIRSIVLFLMLTSVLSACIAAPTAQPTATEQIIPGLVATTTKLTLPPTALLSPTAQPSKTSLATTTPKPTATSTVRPAVTPTFDVANLKTHTSVPPAQCPAEKPEMTPDFEYSSFTAESVGHFFRQVLDFLNAGGTRQAVIAAYHQHDPRANDRTIQEKDVTADGVPELLLTDNDSFAAYVCENGQYSMKWLPVQTYHFGQPVIIAIRDMNLDGVDEIIAIDGDDRIRLVSVVEWDGSDFQLLNWDPAQQSCSDLYGPSWAEAQDADSNGILELVLQQAIPIWTEYTDGFPWREETRTCTWNGKLFVLTHTEIATPPEYRFQAVQDGDRATLAGDYSKALDLYQQAIFSDKLDWWSQDRRAYESTVYMQEGVPKPTPIPPLLPDPAEYPMLAAYARFRIMLLHIVRGFLPEAQIVYKTLQEKFPPSQVGHIQAEMATVFWDEYQVSKSLEQACAKAIEFATLHPAEVLSYLGNSDYTTTYFGNQSLRYKPEDVCPFR